MVVRHGLFGRPQVKWEAGFEQETFPGFRAGQMSPTNGYVIFTDDVSRNRTFRVKVNINVTLHRLWTWEQDSLSEVEQDELFRPVLWAMASQCNHKQEYTSCALTLSLPRVINFKFPLHPHQKYYITQYEEPGFS